jgi:hypothetical protein
LNALVAADVVVEEAEGRINDAPPVFPRAKIIKNPSKNRVY